MSILTFLTPIAQADTGAGSHMMSNYGFMGMGGGYWGGFFAILFWVLAIVGIIFLVKHLLQFRKDKEKRTPKEILEERYAKGEIDKEEFDRKKQDLS